jgi:hypothetical protein
MRVPATRFLRLPRFSSASHIEDADFNDPLPPPTAPPAAAGAQQQQQQQDLEKVRGLAHAQRSQLQVAASRMHYLRLAIGHLLGLLRMCLKHIFCICQGLVQQYKQQQQHVWCQLLCYALAAALFLLNCFSKGSLLAPYRDRRGGGGASNGLPSRATMHALLAEQHLLRPGHAAANIIDFATA